MKRKILIIISALLIIFFIIINGFLIVFWLTTPSDGELRTDEKILFEKIKKNYTAREVQRSPKYHITAPKDKTTYTVIVDGIQCNADTINLEHKAQSIKFEIDKLNLHHNFYKYQILYKCINGKEHDYKFLR